MYGPTIVPAQEFCKWLLTFPNTVLVRQNGCRTAKVSLCASLISICVMLPQSRLLEFIVIVRT